MEIFTGNLARLIRTKREKTTTTKGKRKYSIVLARDNKEYSKIPTLMVFMPIYIEDNCFQLPKMTAIWQIKCKG